MFWYSSLIITGHFIPVQAIQVFSNYYNVWRPTRGVCAWENMNTNVGATSTPTLRGRHNTDVYNGSTLWVRREMPWKQWLNESRISTGKWMVGRLVPFRCVSFGVFFLPTKLDLQATIAAKLNGRRHDLIVNSYQAPDFPPLKFE